MPQAAPAPIPDDQARGDFLAARAAAPTLDARQQLDALLPSAGAGTSAPSATNTSQPQSPAPRMAAGAPAQPGASPSPAPSSQGARAAAAGAPSEMPPGSAPADAQNADPSLPLGARLDQLLRAPAPAAATPGAGNGGTAGTGPTGATGAPAAPQGQENGFWDFLKKTFGPLIGPAAGYPSVREQEAERIQYYRDQVKANPDNPLAALTATFNKFGASPIAAGFGAADLPNPTEAIAQEGAEKVLGAAAGGAAPAETLAPKAVAVAGSDAPKAEAILAQPEVQEAINAPRTIDRTHDVPYLAGSSTGGGVTYIDRRVPESVEIAGADGTPQAVDPAKYLNIHEQTEHALMTEGGMPYLEAHEIATQQERAAVEADGLDWKSYESTLDGYLKGTESEGAKNPPADLYTKPYPHEEAEFLARQGAQEGGAPAAPSEAALPAPVEQRALAAFNEAIDRENNRIGKNPAADENDRYEKINSLADLDEHGSVVAKSVAFEEIAKAMNWKVRNVHGSQTTASAYYELRKPSGLLDADGEDVPLDMKVRVSDHGNSRGGGYHINLAPGADTLDETIEKLQTAHWADTDAEDVVFGNEKSAADDGSRSGDISGPGPQPGAIAPHQVTPIKGGIGSGPQPNAQSKGRVPDVLPPATIGGSPLPAAGESLRVTPEVRAQATDYLNNFTGDNPVQASLARIADPKVMQQAIDGVASFIPRDAVKPDTVLRESAYMTGMQPEDVLAGLKGKLPDDRAMAAWAMLVNSGAKELGTLSRRAVETGNPQDWEAATRAFALQNHILGNWNEAGTDMGRAFRARQLASEARSDYTATVQDIISNLGASNVETAIRKVAALQTPEQMSAFGNALRTMSSREAMLYAWYNYLLGPITVAKKLSTDALFPFWNLATRFTAEKLGSGGVAPGESAQLLYGYTSAIGDAIRAGGRGLMAGRSQFKDMVSSMDGLQRTRTSLLANGGDVPNPSVGTGGAGGAIVPAAKAALPYLRALMPTSWLAGADDFGYTLNYRAELRAAAWREGSGKFLDGDGNLDHDAVGQHIAEQAANPSPAIHSQAVKAADANMFAEPLTGNAQKFADWIDSLNLPIAGTKATVPVGRMLVPFINRPVNFQRWLYRQSPLPLAFPTDAFKAELASGGAARDLAYAKIGLGTALGAAMIPLAVSGVYDGNGPTDPKLRAAWLDAGHVPYSLRVPGQRPITLPVEPFSRIMGAVGDAADTMRFAHGADIADIAGSIIFGLGHAFMSTTYMSTLSHFMEAVQNTHDASRFVEDMLTSMALPRVATQSAGVIDPWLRAHYGLLQSIESKFPYLSKNLPAQQDEWGRPIPLRDAYLPLFSGSGLAHMVSPFQLGPSPDQVEPIDKWKWDHRADFSNGDPELPRASMVQSWQQGNGVKANVQLTPEQLARLRELAGNGLKDPRSKLGALDTLNALVSGNGPSSFQREWNQASDPERAIMVQRIASQFRGEAKKQLVREYPDIGDAIAAQWSARRQQLRPSAPASAPVQPGAPAGAAPATGGAMPRIE